MMDTPGTRLGRWLEEMPSSICEADRVTTMLTGRPVRANQSPLRSHPPISLRQAAVQEAAPGAERTLIDRTVGDVLARVIRRDATVAGPAGNVFHPYGFARAD